MPSSARRIDALEQELADLGEEAMLLSEFDGFVAGLLVCPELIPPSEWLAHVWSGDDTDDEDDVFESEDHLRTVIAAIMAHYNAVADTLHKRPAKYQPLFEIDDQSGEILWEMWASGFGRALRLRSKAWAPLLEKEGVEAIEDDETTLAFGLLALMVAVADGREDETPLEGERLELFQQTAQDAIPGLVGTLYKWRKTLRAEADSGFSAGPKVGRNEPCPCGSGKKYKKCCGAG